MKIIFATLALLHQLLSLCFCEVLFENSAVVPFSGTDFPSSTGWIYSFTTVASEQWGRLHYLIDSIDATGDRYAHVTFVAIENGRGYYQYTNGQTMNTTQTLRVVDSVGSTLLMQNTPDQSVQYLLNIDTGTADGELNVVTEYIYSFDSNWTCMEWHTSAADQEIRLYENGVETYAVDGGITFTGPSTGASIKFSFGDSLDLRVGMYTYNGVSVSGRFKDVVVATERVGCGDSSDVGDTSEASENESNSDASDGSTSTGMTHEVSMLLAFGIAALIVIVLIGLGTWYGKRMTSVHSGVQEMHVASKSEVSIGAE